MNIFLTDPDPVRCASILDDRRVNKMALESAQMLSTAIRMKLDSFDQRLYRKTHWHHPATVFVGESVPNFLWLYDHGVALCHEYTARFDRKHKCLDILNLCLQHLSMGEGYKFANPDLPRDQPVFSFNCSGYDTGDVFQDYRKCMVHKWNVLDQEPTRTGKSKAPRWTNRKQPAWRYSEGIIK